MAVTPTYNLPLYEPEDQPDLLIQYNEALAIIDSVLENVDTDIEQLKLDVNNLDAEYAQLRGEYDSTVINVTNSINDINGILIKVNSDIEALQKAIGDDDTDIGALNERVTNLESRATSIESTLGDLITQITNLSGDLTGVKNTVDGLSDKVAQNTEDISTINSKLDGVPRKLVLFDSTVSKSAINMSTLSWLSDTSANYSVLYEEIPDWANWLYIMGDTKDEYFRKGSQTQAESLMNENCIHTFSLNSVSTTGVITRMNKFSLMSTDLKRQLDQQTYDYSGELAVIQNRYPFMISGTTFSQQTSTQWLNLAIPTMTITNNFNNGVTGYDVKYSDTLPQLTQGNALTKLTFGVRKIWVTD